MNPINILLVEDNEGDIVLTSEALLEANIVDNLKVIKEGCQVIDYLLRNGKYFEAKKPDLILLDINLPKFNGLDILKNIRSVDILKHIPVIILSTSSSYQDIKLSNDYEATSYLTKPINQEGYDILINSIKEIWCTLISNSNSK